MFEFSVIISITLNNKTYEEAIGLERDLIDDIGQECDPRFKIKTYLHSKTFDTKFKIPTAEKDLIDKLNSKKCIFITPNIKDYDVILHLLAYIKRWRNRMDENKYGRSVTISVDSRTFGEPIFYSKASNKYGPSLTRLARGNISKAFTDQMEEFNKAIDEVPVYIKKEGDEELEVAENKIKRDPMVEKFLRDFPIK